MASTNIQEVKIFKIDVLCRSWCERLFGSLGEVEEERRKKDHKVMDGLFLVSVLAILLRTSAGTNQRRIIFLAS